MDEARYTDKIQPDAPPFWALFIRWFMGLATIWKSVACLTLAIDSAFVWITGMIAFPQIPPLCYVPCAFLVINGAFAGIVLLIKAMSDDLSS